MNKKKLLKKSRPIHKVEFNAIISLYKSEPRSITPTRSSKQPISTIAEFTNKLINSSCKTLKRKKSLGLKPKLTTPNSPLKPRVSADFKEKNIFKTDKTGTPARSKLDAAFQGKKLLKIYRLTPTNSPLSGRSLAYSSRDQISQRSYCKTDEVKTVKMNEVVLEFKNRTEKVNLEYVLNDHRNSVNGIVLNNNNLFTGSQDYSVKKWKFLSTDANPYKGKEYVDGQVLKTNKVVFNSSRPVLHLCFLHPSILIASLPNSLKIFKDSCLSHSKKLDFYPSYLISHNDYCLIAGSSSIYKLDLDKFILSPSCQTDNTTILEPWNEFCYISGDSRGNLKTTDLRSQRIISTQHIHFESVSGISINDKLIYTCSPDGYLKHWDLRYNKLLYSQNSFGSLKKVGFIKDRILTGGDCFRIWTEDYPIIISTEHCKDIKHKGNSILASADNKVMVWNLQTLNTTNEYI